jgi:hypothetical protein
VEMLLGGRLRHRSCLDDQSEVKLFEALDMVKQQLRRKLSICCQADKIVLKDDLIEKVLKKLARWSLLQWHPGYGCVLLGIPCDGDELELSILGLDEWEHSVHSYFDEGTTKREHAAICKSSKVLHVGGLAVANYEKFLLLMSRVFRRAASASGDGRSAASGSIGHQRTPAFIAAVVKTSKILMTMDVSDEKKFSEAMEKHAIQPKGALTDVGLHTGGKARYTGWPLVRELLFFVVRDLEPDNASVLCQLLEIRVFITVTNELFETELKSIQILPRYLDTAIVKNGTGVT